MIPMDELEGRLDDAAHRRLVMSSAEANMNTLRVWGGGMPEPGPNVRWVGGEIRSSGFKPIRVENRRRGERKGEKTILALAWKHRNSMVHNYHFVQ